MSADRIEARLDDFKRRVAALPSLSGATLARLQAILDAASDGERGGRARPAIAVFDAKPYEMRVLQKHNAGRFELNAVEASLTPDTASAAAGCVAACVFVNDRCDAAAVDALSEQGVGLIALRCSGYNNVDLAVCRARGIEVVRVPAYSPHAVAEHAVALLLMLNRKLHIAYARNRSGVFTLDGLTGFDLHGKTVGVIGTGAIGACVAQIARGFGCQVLAHDRSPNPAFDGDPGVRYVGLDELLRGSHVVTLHVPLFDETHHLIDEAAIEKMRGGAILINTSRGGLVDTRALIRGLKSGKIGAAGLDVYEEEAGIFFRDVSDKVLTDDVLARLMSFNNVVVTSHQAFLTEEALDAIAQDTLDSVAEYAAGKRGDQLTRRVGER